jgi:hypothetical protein
MRGCSRASQTGGSAGLAWPIRFSAAPGGVGAAFSTFCAGGAGPLAFGFWLWLCLPVGLPAIFGCSQLRRLFSSPSPHLTLSNLLRPLLLIDFSRSRCRYLNQQGIVSSLSPCCSLHSVEVSVTGTSGPNLGKIIIGFYPPPIILRGIPTQSATRVCSRTLALYRLSVRTVSHSPRPETVSLPPIRDFELRSALHGARASLVDQYIRAGSGGLEEFGFGRAREEGNCDLGRPASR